MTHASSEQLLSDVSQFVEARLGLHFPQERWRDLERNVAAAARQLGHSEVLSCLRWLVSSSPSQKQIEVLAAHLTVGETYFFRDKNTFDTLQEIVFPELLRARLQERRLRVWSAGCSTGEEPYSLAILLHRLIPSLPDWNITILATDINLEALGKARAGIYGEWSFRGTPPWVRSNYFGKARCGRYEIAPSIKEMVSFSYLNLAEDAYPSLVNNTNAVDLILCRNVLMYFSSGRAKRVVEKLYRALVEGGWLMVSASELSQSLFAKFTTVNWPGIISYRKEPRNEAGVADAAVSCGLAETEAPRPTLAVTAFPTLPPETEAERAAGQTDGGDSPPIPESPEVGSSQTSYECAWALYQQGRYVEARASLEQSASEEGGEAARLALLARVCANEGRLPEALGWCARAIACNKLHPGYHYLRAAILQEQGEANEAAASLRRAVYLDQDFVLAHFALSSLELRLGNRRAWRAHRKAALSVLGAYCPNDILPESDGMTAARLEEIIRNVEAWE